MEHNVTKYLDARLSLHEIPLARPAAGAGPGLVAKLRAWRKKRQARRDLEALDDRLLADIGLDRADIGAVVEGLLTTGSGRRATANDNCAACAA